MNDIVNQLVDYLKTKDGLANFISRIDALLLETTGVEFNNLARYFSQKEISLMLTSINSIDDLRSLREKLTRVEVFNIRLSFIPSALFEGAISDKIVKLTKDPCVTHFTIDRRILGGAIIDYQGRYRDFSLKNAIDDWRKGKAHVKHQRSSNEDQK